jgi:hypothetical protein
MTVKQSNVLNVRMAKDNNDERHLCPLQLDVIERALIMWSNPDDIVLSPFMGIGSEGVSSLKLERRFVGIELKEGYSGYSKRSLAGIKQLIEDIIKNCAEKIANEKKTPTIRKKRRRSPIDVVKKLKYKKEDAEYAMISIVASKVVEAQKLVVFNTKYRAVTIYEADSSHGLSVKGTTIIGFDPKKSKTKRLRKPKDFFAKIKDKGIKVVRSTFESIRAVEKPATGRINQDTILYGVYQ